MAFSMNNSPKINWRQFTNPRSPRFNRTRLTKRQQRVYNRSAKACLHGLDMQIGGGQCGHCGKFTHRHLVGFKRNKQGYLVAPK